MKGRLCVSNGRAKQNTEGISALLHGEGDGGIIWGLEVVVEWCLVA